MVLFWQLACKVSGCLGVRKSELVNRIDKAIGEVIAAVDRVTTTASMVKEPERSGGNQKRPPNDLDPAKASARDVPTERSANTVQQCKPTVC